MIVIHGGKKCLIKFHHEKTTNLGIDENMAKYML